MHTSQTVAQVLLEIGAVGFSVDSPITFKSGMLSPVYVDNRILPFYPKAWKVILNAMVNIIEEEGLEPEVVAGIESAGIPHSATLGYLLHKPSVFCRKQIKGHGTKKMIEGGDVVGKKVLLVEDLVTTGGSSLAGVETVRESGGTVTDCLCIVSYGFSESVKAFAQAKVKLHALTQFDAILRAGEGRGLSREHRRVVKEWLADPWAWTAINKRK
jgi:orotate phosphoribosyltransferase